MLILNSEQIRQWDTYTIENEPITSIDLMERAATTVFNRMLPKLASEQLIHVIAGTGNNGGDGLVLARLLLHHGFSVKVWIVRPSEKCSNDFETNLARLKQIPYTSIHEIASEQDFPSLLYNEIVIDSIFGSGLHSAVQGITSQLIEWINQSQAVVIAIDMPSGLFADKANDLKNDPIIKADYTYTFETLKLSFIFPENEYFIGQCELVSIGLHKGFLSELKAEKLIVEEATVRAMRRPRGKFAHKGSFGHALLIAGSEGKSGAAILAAMACLRSGVGLLHVHLPSTAAIAMQVALPEAMTNIDASPTHFSQLPDISVYNAVGVGPGIGKHDETAIALKLLIQNSTLPIVLDADALNILSENKTWLPFLPAGSILTPHSKEFERLVGKWANSFERLELQLKLSQRLNVYVVLKGAFTSITTPNGVCYFNQTGNPGMATAGSGDVLTGIILGLLAQNYTSLQACVSGVYLHGLAGDLAAKEWGYESLIASDITAHLGKAFLNLNS